MTSITPLLLNSLSHDAGVRVEAEATLERARVENRCEYLRALACEVASSTSPKHARQLAGVMFKNALDAKDENKKREVQQQWLAIANEQRMSIKATIWQTLGDEASEIRHVAAQVVAKIAGAEIPHKQWPDLIANLQTGASGASGVAAKQAALEALGYICEEIEADDLDQTDVNGVLTAVVSGMGKNETDVSVRLAATQALNNALYFAHENFTRQQERDFIMQCVCEATTCEDVRVRVAAFEVLVSIAENYYEYMSAYIEAVYQLTVNAAKQDKHEVGLQAIEFWSTICEEEIGRQEAIECGENDVEMFGFISKALTALVPMLLEQLTKQEDDQDEDENAWNMAMAGGTCLGLVSQLVRDPVVDQVMMFIQQNIQSGEWRQREAATFAFGAILEGPDPAKLANVANEALPHLIMSLKDQSAHVRDTTAWTIGRVFEFVQSQGYTLVDAQKFPQVLQAMLESVKDVPHVAGKVVWSIQHLVSSVAEDAEIRETLSQHFQGIIQALLLTSERPDAEVGLKMECYEAMNEIIRSATQENYSTIGQLIPHVLQKLAATFEGQEHMGAEQLEKQADAQALLCGTLQVIIQVLGGANEATKAALSQYADSLMQAFLTVFACRSATVHEEAMLAVGALAYAVGSGFVKYMDAFFPFVKLGLENHEEHQVCSVTVGVVGDICRALDEKVVPYCDGIVYALLRDLESEKLHRNVKPPILSCFGDLALATGPAFEKYVPYVLSMLQSATQLTIGAKSDDDEMNEYNNQLRNGIFEAYAGILQGFKSDPSKLTMIREHTPSVLALVETVAADPSRDEVVTRSMVGVLGDMADTIDQIGPLFAQRPFYKGFLKECQQSNDASLRDTANWAAARIADRVNQ
jgi:importin subunit beta-1